MKFTSLFCASTDPSVSDFLLTHPVFMPYSQLCAALQHQYPSSTTGNTDNLLLFDISVLLMLYLLCFGQILLLNLHSHLPSGAIRRLRPGEGSVCSQHQAKGCETGGSLGGSVWFLTEGQSCGLWILRGKNAVVPFFMYFTFHKFRFW